MKTFKIWQTFSNSLLYFSYIFPDQKPKTAEKRCRANLCNQDPSYDNILDNYCQADFGEYFDFWLTFTYIYKIIRSFERLKSCIKVYCNTLCRLQKGLCLLKFIFYLFFVVVKMKFKTIRKRNLQGRKVNSVYKAPRADKDALRKLRKPKLKLQSSDECCAQWIRRQPQKTRFLVMGNSEDSSMESLVPTFIIPWSRNKVRKLH